MKAGVSLISTFLILLTVGCSNGSEQTTTNAVQTQPTTLTPNADPVLVADSASTSSPIDPLEEFELLPADSSLPSLPIDQSGIALSENGLTQMLETNYVFENQQVIPTTAWICADGVGQNRTYYFYPQAVLDASRNVTVERTLNPNNTHSDIVFFWSVTGSDSILLTAANRDDIGNLISSGRQYDVSSLRFDVVDDRNTFTAQSVLRGQLICGYYDLQ